MTYIYKQSNFEHGFSPIGDIVFVSIVMVAIFAFSFWYMHNADKLVNQGCVAAGYASCSTFSNTPVK